MFLDIPNQWFPVHVIYVPLSSYFPCFDHPGTDDQQDFNIWLACVSPWIKSNIFASLFFDDRSLEIYVLSIVACHSAKLFSELLQVDKTVLHSFASQNLPSCLAGHDIGRLHLLCRRCFNRLGHELCIQTVPSLQNPMGFGRIRLGRMGTSMVPLSHGGAVAVICLISEGHSR